MTPAIDPTEMGQARGMAWLIAVLLSMVVVVVYADRLDIAPSYGGLQKELYDNAGDWRSPPSGDYAWRQETREGEGRIQFGYDSAFEEMRVRERDAMINSGSPQNPSAVDSQFRLRF